MDGTGVPVRAAEVAGRAGKQLDGSAKTREAKLVTVWTAQSRDSNGIPMRDPGSVTCSAAIESAATADTNPDRSDFAERVLREATRRGFTQPARCVVLGDGSTWIWNTARERFPQATQILDRYHAKEALHRAAQSIFGVTSESKPWAAVRCTELDDGKLHAVVHARFAQRTSHSEATKCALYIFHNRARMRYPKFHAQGLCTSTGAFSRPAAKWQSVPGSSGLACTGPCKVPTPSSLCAAASSADVSRISGRAAKNGLPRDPQI